MKKTISLLLSVVILLSALAFASITSFAATSGDYEYELLDDGTAEITGYSGNVTNLTIPTTLDGHTVTSIGNDSFFYASFISVSIPDSITNIGDAAFSCCNNLASITIPNSVTSIGYSAFDHCSSLTNVTIGNSVTTIGDEAFFGSGLTRVIIPDSVKTLGDNVFDSCYELESATIGNGVETIGFRAFATCYELKSVTIGKGVKTICDEAFYSCDGLTDVYYAGTEAQWKQISVGSDNEYLTDSSIHYNSAPSVDDEHQHSYNSVVTPPTCTEQGYTTHTCLECGDSYIDSYVAAKGHTPDNGTVTKVATCTATGTKTYKCTVCGVTTKTETIAATGHKPDNGTVTKVATCTATGTKTYKCTVCGVTTKTETIAKTGHTVVTDKAVAATCTKDGKTVGSHCSVCGTVITAQTTVKATGHSWDNGKVTKEATYTATGVKTYTCTKCGATKTETIAKKTAATPKISSVSNVVAGVKVTWGKVTGAEKYRVFYKTGNGSWTKAGDTTSTSYTWTGAKNNTKYSFTVRCMDKDGNYISSYDSTGKSITFMSAPTVSVSNVVAGVKVSWGKVTGAANYAIFRKTPDGSYKKIGTATGTSYTDTTAKNNTKYVYAVRCATSDGNTYTSSYNAGKSITFMSAPTVSVSNVVAGVKVSWGKVSGASNYAIFRKTPDGSYKKIGTATGTSYTDKTAKNNTKYIYAVRCASKDGKTYTSSYNAGKSITFMSAPTVSVSNVVAGVKISWSKVSGAANYAIFRKTPNGSYKKIGTTTGTSFVDKTAKSGTKYIYTVRCATKDGKTYTSSYNAGKSITFISAPTFKVAKVSNGVKITWSKVTGAVNYKVYRKTANGSYKAVGTTTGTSFVDKTAKKGTKYIYTVRCVSKDGKTNTSSYNAGKSITR